MPREQRRRQDARGAKLLVQSGQAVRRRPTLEQAQAILLGIDNAEVQLLGIKRLAALELDGLQLAPWCCPWTEWLTLLDYASWRGRDRHIVMLLNAGADPSGGLLPPGCLDRLPKAYAAWVARAAARMRQVGARATEIDTTTNINTNKNNNNNNNINKNNNNINSNKNNNNNSNNTSDNNNNNEHAKSSGSPASCGCGRPGTLRFAPCGHLCCPSCPWREFRTGELGKLPELRCPSCDASYAEPCLEFQPSRRGIIKNGPLAEVETVACQRCGCAIERVRPSCFNCSWPLSVPVAVLPAPGHPAPPTCWQGALSLWQLCTNCWLGPDRERRATASRHTASLARWMALPEETPELAAERLELKAALSAVAPEKAPDLKTSTRRMASAFRALDPAATAADKLGATRANRVEKLRVAAEVGDARRVAALFEAGADADAVNEYGQSALFLAAFEGHLESVEVLLHWGADATLPSHGGTQPAAAAAAKGHEAVWRLLMGRGCPTACLPLGLPRPDRTFSAQVLATQLPLPQGLLSAGAFYVDGAFDEWFLEWLEALWSSLPQAAFAAGVEGEMSPKEPCVDGIGAKEVAQEAGVAARRKKRHVVDRSRQVAAPRRSYFCDADGRVAAELASALRLVREASEQSFECTEAVPQMRFLHYAKPGGYLAPHIDLPRKDWRT
ncbi:unnamed protein product, partial [Polarella glacialis]